MREKCIAFIDKMQNIIVSVNFCDASLPVRRMELF